MHRAPGLMLPVALARGARPPDLIFERRRCDPVVGLGLGSLEHGREQREKPPSSYAQRALAEPDRRHGTGGFVTGVVV